MSKFSTAIAFPFLVLFSLGIGFKIGENTTPQPADHEPVRLRVEGLDHCAPHRFELQPLTGKALAELNPELRWCGVVRVAYRAYMAARRPSHAEMTPEQRQRSNARAYANTYQKRGHLTPQPCRDCGSLQSQKHHEDYGKPLDVIWLCRPCHLAHHRNQTN